MLGLGGGVFLVPIFTLFFGIDPKLAIGASAVAVVTNSVVGSTVHLSSRFTNLRLAMLLQVPTAAGALVGALLAVRAPDRDTQRPLRRGADLRRGFDVSAAQDLAYRHEPGSRSSACSGQPTTTLPPNVTSPTFRARSIEAWDQRHRRHDFGDARGRRRRHSGSGDESHHGDPVKAAAGTSAVMVGITAVATSFVFYADNKIDPRIVLPAMIGIVLGAQIGSRLTRRVRTDRLIIVFVLVLLYLGFRLIMEALNIDLPSF